MRVEDEGCIVCCAFVFDGYCFAGKDSRIGEIKHFRAYLSGIKAYAAYFEYCLLSKPLGCINSGYLANY